MPINRRIKKEEKEKVMSMRNALDKCRDALYLRFAMKAGEVQIFGELAKFWGNMDKRFSSREMRDDI